MSKRRNKRGVRLIHVFLIFLVLYVAIVLNHQRGLMKNLDSKKVMNQAEVDKLEKEIEALNKEIESSDSLEFVEKIARDELGMVKPREIIYIDKNKPKNRVFDIFKKDN